MSEPRHEPAADSVDRQLEELLADAEETVTRLRRELDARRVAGIEAQRLAEQHAEIDRLREHLALAQVHWGEVRDFFEAALDELAHGDQPSEGAGSPSEAEANEESR